MSFTTNAGAGNDFNIFDYGGGNYDLLAEGNDPGLLGLARRRAAR